MFSKKESDKDNKLGVPRELPDLASDKYPFDEAILKSNQKENNSITQAYQKNSAPKELPNISPQRYQKKHLPTLDDDIILKKETGPKPQIQEKTAETYPTQQYIETRSEPVKEPEPRIIYVEKPAVCEPNPILVEQKINDEPKKPQNNAQSPSFFSKFEDLLSQNIDQTKIIDEIINKDLLHKMRDYHDSITTDTPFYLHTKDLLNGVTEKINRLQLLENEWYYLRGELKELQKQVTDKEDQIGKEILKLKNILFIIKVREKINKQIRVDQYFTLPDKQKLKSIDELTIALKSMRPEDYRHHVTEYKNDFANWIDGVFELKELADRIRQTKTKEDMIKILNQVTF